MIETSQRDRALDPSVETIGAIEDNHKSAAAAEPTSRTLSSPTCHDPADMLDSAAEVNGKLLPRPNGAARLSGHWKARSDGPRPRSEGYPSACRSLELRCGSGERGDREAVGLGVLLERERLLPRRVGGPPQQGLCHLERVRRQRYDSVAPAV